MTFTSKVNNISICKGENTLQFRFVLKENYGYKRIKQNNLPIPVFEIRGIKLQPNQHITILHQGLSLLKLESQDEILRCLKKKYKIHLHSLEPNIITLNGKADVGKSMILDNFLVECSIYKHIIFYREFTESMKENAKILLYLLIYILFPYVSPDTIDELYIDEIKNTDIKNLLLNFIKYKNDHENILVYIDELLGNPALIPNKISINRRIIVLDNMHLLDKKAHFLYLKLYARYMKKNYQYIL